jgi:peptidoglycan/LPS O-acetylase OafA/YrhL
MLRILPLYYGALVILFVMPHLVTAPGAPKFFVSIKGSTLVLVLPAEFCPLRPLFVGLAGHFWSLAVEEQFYLIWPLVILSLSRKQALRVCALLLPFSIIYRALMPHLSPPFSLSTSTFAQLDGLAVGSALALLYRTEGGVDWIKQRLNMLAAASLGTMIVIEVLRLSFLRHTVLSYFSGCFFRVPAGVRSRGESGRLARFLRSNVMRSSAGTATACTCCTFRLCRSRFWLV